MRFFSSSDFYFSACGNYLTYLTNCQNQITPIRTIQTEDVVFLKQDLKGTTRSIAITAKPTNQKTLHKFKMFSRDKKKVFSNS